MFWAQAGGQALILGPVTSRLACRGQNRPGPGPWVLWASSGTRRLPVGAGARALCWGGTSAAKPQESSPAVPGAAPASSCHCAAGAGPAGPRRAQEGACLTILAPCPRPCQPLGNHTDSAGRALSGPWCRRLAARSPLWGHRHCGLAPRPPLLPTLVAAAKRPAPPHAF